uniref:hypothetical protein n=1 Tax=Streptomyces sp. rh79 TaxID=3028727 RepID=UPI003C7B2DC1
MATGSAACAATATVWKSTTGSAAGVCATAGFVAAGRVRRRRGFASAAVSYTHL